MKRSIVIIAMTIMLSVLFCNHALASGYIKGQLSIKETKDYSVVTVTIFNNANAEIVNIVAPQFEGGFISGPLPAGQYRVHFKYYGSFKDLCVDEFFGQPEAHLAIFDLAVEVPVEDKIETDLGTVFLPYNTECGVSECVPHFGVLMGNVFNSSTLEPIPSIQVKFKDPISAFPIFNEVTTDANGFFVLEVQKSCSPLEAKIRFYDPNGIYSPEYYGAGGVDSFSLGKEVQFVDIKVEIKEDLAKLPPAQQILGIIEDIQTILPPQDAQPVVSSLQQGQTLLQDTNPNNDKGACGILTGTTNKMKGLVSSGSLSQADADALIALIEALKTDLGCKK